MGGGGGGLNVPNEIWSPAGGFFADPKKWRRNTVLAVLGMTAIALPIYFKSRELEQRHALPKHPILSPVKTSQ